MTSSLETDNEEYFGDVINDLLSVLIEEEMITFLDDVPNIVVTLSIDKIDNTNNLFIETFHHNMDDENDFLFDRDIDVPMELKDFKLKVYQKYGVPIV